MGTTTTRAGEDDRFGVWRAVTLPSSQKPRVCFLSSSGGGGSGVASRSSKSDFELRWGACGARRSADFPGARPNHRQSRRPGKMMMGTIAANQRRLREGERTSRDGTTTRRRWKWSRYDATEDNGISSSFYVVVRGGGTTHKTRAENGGFGRPDECKSCALVLPTPEMSGQSSWKSILTNASQESTRTIWTPRMEERKVSGRFRRRPICLRQRRTHVGRLNRGDHSKIDEKVKHKILVLRTLEEEDNSDSSSSTKIRTKIGIGQAEGGVDFGRSEGWWSWRMSSLRKRQGCSHLYLVRKVVVRLSRVHDVDETLLRVDDGLRYLRRGIDNIKADYFSTLVQSKANVGRALVRCGAHFHTRRSREGDYGVAVKTVVDQEKLAREKAAKRTRSRQKEQDEAQAAIKRRKKQRTWP